MDELDAMKAVSSALGPLPESERHRVLAWAWAKFADGVAQAPPVPGAPRQKGPGSPARPNAFVKKAKKTKSLIAMDKSLNLSPKGQQSAAEFASAKAPTNVTQKCVVAAYYLRDTLGLDNINVSSVYTFFKTIGWPIPTDLRNTLQQAGSKGWLDTADSDDIKVTSMGENLVEHSLPPKPA